MFFSSILSLDRLDDAADLQAAFQKYNVALFRYTRVRVGERVTAEDIVQDVFVKAWTRRETYNPEKASLKTWLYTLTTNTIRDYYRTSKKPIVELTEEVPTTENIATEYAQSDEARQVLCQVRNLSELEQELIALRYIEEMSIREVADVIGKRLSATKVALHRAVKKLQQLCNNAELETQSQKKV